MVEAPPKAKKSTKTPPATSSKGSEDSPGRHIDAVSEGAFLPSSFEKTEHRQPTTNEGASMLSLQEMVDASVKAEVRASMLSLQGIIDASVDAKVRALMPKVENIPDADPKDGSKARAYGSSLAAAAPSDIGSDTHSGKSRKEKAGASFNPEATTEYYDAPYRIGDDGINNQDENDATGAFCPPSQRAILWFNRTCYVVCFGIFIYLTSTIVMDYMHQWEYDAPLTGLSVYKDPLQLFPGIIVCNLARKVETSILTSDFGSDWIRSYTNDITDYWKPLDCGTNVTRCWQLDAPLPAFGTDSISGISGGCMEPNNIDVSFNLSESQASRYGVRGMHGILYDRKQTERMTEFMCSSQTRSCGSAGDSDHTCSSHSGDLSYNRIYASGGMGNIVLLKHSETQQGGPHCDAQNNMLQSWSPTNVAFPLNKPFVESMNATDADPLVSLRFKFRNHFVEKRTYQPTSAATMFGSVAGWFGFLSDGWGSISLLFMIERYFWPSMMIGGKAVVYAKRAASDTARFMSKDRLSL